MQRDRICILQPLFNPQALISVKMTSFHISVPTGLEDTAGRPSCTELYKVINFLTVCLTLWNERTRFNLKSTETIAQHHLHEGKTQ